MTRAADLYAIAASLYDRGEWDAARWQYEAANSLALSEANSAELEHVINSTPTLVPVSTEVAG